MKTLSIVLCLLFILHPLFGATDAESTADDTTEEYKPYSIDEFPVWLQELRRAEIIFFGSFPVAMLLSTLGYEGFRSIRGVLTANSDSSGASFEFGNYDSPERKGLLIAGVSLSFVVAVLDYLLGRIDTKGKQGNE